MTKRSFMIADLEKMSVKELHQIMIEHHMAHIMIPFSEHMHFHAALIFDFNESEKLRAHLDKVTEAAITTANARSESQCDAMSALGRCVKEKNHEGPHRNDKSGGWLDKEKTQQH